MKKSLSYCIFFVVCWGQLAAQGGVAIVDLDVVLGYMPETQTMRQELQTFENNKLQELRPLQDSVRNLGRQIQQQQQAGVDEEACNPISSN